MTLAKTQFPPYSQMVADLFKPMEGIGARMMHATIGMAGESAELREANSRKNLLEEFGDIEFYMEAAWLELPHSVREMYGAQLLPEVVMQFGEICNRIHVVTGNLLDYSKKVWVYGGAKGDRDDHIASELLLLRALLYAAYELVGTDVQDVRYGNQVKLLGTAEEKGRYADGTYSDEQALARADKAGEPVAAPKRKFFGQKQD